MLDFNDAPLQDTGGYDLNDLDEPLIRPDGIRMLADPMLADSSAQVGTVFTGMVTDSHCGARHMRNSHQTASECARACFRRGASYVLVNGEHRYTLIGGEGSLSKLAGERANVIGTRQGDAILVDSAAAIF